MHLHLDFESRSPIDIKKCGAYAYAEHTDTEVLCLGVKADDRPTKVWVPTQFEDLIPAEEQATTDTLRIMIRNAETISAHNANFERCMWSEHMVRRLGLPEIPLEKWDDTAARAAMCALPRSLDGATKALGLDEEKDLEGYKLMLKMCKPKALTKKERIILGDEIGWPEGVIQDAGKEIMAALKVDPRAPRRLRNFSKFAAQDYHLFFKYHFTPADFVRLCAYCAQDVEAEYALDKALPRMPKMERQIWRLDQTINDRGIMADMASVDHASVIIEEHGRTLQAELQEITGGTVDSAKAVAQMTEWLGENGCQMEDLTKQSVKDAVAGDLPPDVRRVLEIRQSLSKSSTAKLAAIKAFACRDGRLRGMFLYHGAATGRWCLAEDTQVLVMDLNHKIYYRAIQDVQLSDKLWDGQEWVAHEGVVFSGVKDTIEWEGVRATREHKVFVNDKESVPLEYAQKHGLPLYQGDPWNTPST